MPLDLLDRRLVFVTGKGGVGKSTVASALALAGAQRGKRVLVAEVDAKGNLADFFECGPTRFEPREVRPGLFAMTMDTEESLKEYLSLQLKLPLLAKIGPLARTFDFVANAAPGVKEILTIGKFVYEVREHNYDLVVVDAVATGHILGQLTAAEGINELVQVGLVRSQTGWMMDILVDPAQTGLVIVTTPEEMPVNETCELVEGLEERTRVDLAAIVVNRVLPELFGRDEEAVFERLCQPDAVEVLGARLGGDPTHVLDAANLAVALRRSRVEHLVKLSERVGDRAPLLHLPYLFARTHGMRSTAVLAEALTEELGH